jgi:L-asparaginase/archaeal Glu-tRNAGln amidotransferase subunit D
VTVFSLGGTIASTNTPGDTAGVTPRLGAQELVNAVPQLREAAELETVAFRQTASGDLNLHDLVALAAEITKRFDDGATGAVVTQGTDTIEETSFALDLLVRRPQPVVVTGAMRNPTLAGPDGPANLLAAVQVAASPQAAGLGTLVVFNDEIHAARFVRKTHTSSTATFRSLTVGPVGWVVEGHPRIAFRAAELRCAPISAGAEIPAVALLKSTLGDDSRLIEQVAAVGYAGLVVEAFGGGHVPAHVVPALDRLAGRMPVVLASRTGSGEVLRETYGFPGSERDLLSRGLIHAGFLDGPKSRILLSLLLATGADTAAVREAFGQINASVFA